MPAETLILAFALSHLLLGGAFVYAGVRNLRNIPVLTQLIAARGVPQARFILLSGIGLQIACGTLVAAGLWASTAAAALVVFLVTATLLFHNFWDYEGLDRANRINGVVSNTALVGAFLLVIAAAQ
ncbi:DoxX family protein [Chelativorans salis]|uniref:DoxX family protein n=1 Tax=Chelativorans salis TaxID=2978478 RepID=A0ABT2LKZ9_9HYPH|nr:DoxX family protein [Chelativorans sp. EGI FJ00035]MCT7374956.1 DoxX family protein [Chelativorans sp. EGI FJ00035]